MEAEAQILGEDVNQIKAGMAKVQSSLEALKVKLRAMEEQAAVDASARAKAETLRNLIAAEDPKLTCLLDEKRRSYENGCERLKNLKREHIHLQHAQKQLQSTVLAEFRQWRAAVERRYPLEVAAATAAVAAATESAEEAAAPALEDARMGWVTPPAAV